MNKSRILQVLYNRLEGLWRGSNGLIDYQQQNPTSHTYILLRTRYLIWYNTHCSILINYICRLAIDWCQHFEVSKEKHALNHGKQRQHRIPSTSCGKEKGKYGTWTTWIRFFNSLTFVTEKKKKWYSLQVVSRESHEKELILAVTDLSSKKLLHCKASRTKGLCGLCEDLREDFTNIFEACNISSWSQRCKFMKVYEGQSLKI